MCYEKSVLTFNQLDFMQHSAISEYSRTRKKNYFEFYISFLQTR